MILKGSVLNAQQQDAIKEVGNICVGNSTGILSQLFGGRVEVHLPALDIISTGDISSYVKEKGKLVYGVNVQITAHLEGTIFLLFPEKDSLKIIDKFMSGVDLTGLNFTQFGISILKEIGGISIFTYITTLSSLIKKLILSSVPNFLSGTIDELLHMMLREYEHWGNVCVIHTAFHEESLDIEGGYYLILNKSSAEFILKTIL
ncbi:MAG: chemotaxis protein CheC [Candidatus Omnitrophica bacterium]|nr:chemotaxis protein CheC [Candidatus Omnitrophota bacterium]MBU1925315.1 chemotaxis protein CheC [Candidatus Omnitrophota bacterium]